MGRNVVDTNVLVVANGRHGRASDECTAAAITALLETREAGIIVDEGREIFEQYRRHASYSGQPGTGDAFWKWLWDNQANSAVCRQVTLTRVGDSLGEYAEFPQDPELSTFDRSDRVFVAVALASGEQPKILNATDTDWWDARHALARNDVDVRFLCPDLMRDR